MPRETIESLKKQMRGLLRDAAREREAAIDGLVRQHATQMNDMSARNERQSVRINELIDRHNERLLEQAKKTDEAYAREHAEIAAHAETKTALEAARDRIANLQAALSASAIVTAELARRAEG